MAKMKLRRWGNALVLVFGLLVALIVLEVGLRVSGVSAKLYSLALNINIGYLDVLEVSGDPFLLYQMRPGAMHHYADAREDWRGNCGLERGELAPHSVHINAVGARGPEIAHAKAPGVIRILAVGGSSTFGTVVEDKDTWPAQLQAVLNAGLPGTTNEGARYEVLNYGLPGYSTGQAAHLARSTLDLLTPDLVIVQIYNGCVRNYLPQDPRVEDPALADDLSLFEVFPPSNDRLAGFAAQTHFWLLRNSSSYLSVRASLRLLWDVGIREDALHCGFVDHDEMKLLHEALAQTNAKLAYFRLAYEAEHQAWLLSRDTHLRFGARS
jgi:hypothetical protein